MKLATATTFIEDALEIPSVMFSPAPPPGAVLSPPLSSPSVGASDVVFLAGATSESPESLPQPSSYPPSFWLELPSDTLPSAEGTGNSSGPVRGSVSGDSVTFGAGLPCPINFDSVEVKFQSGTMTASGPWPLSAVRDALLSSRTLSFALDVVNQSSDALKAKLRELLDSA